MTDKIKNQLVLHIPYLCVSLFMTKLSQGFRLAYGLDLSEKLLNVY